MEGSHTRIECSMNCHKVKVACDALKSIGDVVAVKFTKDTIECQHSNAKANVFIELKVYTDELLNYKYESNEPEVIIGINPSKISADLPNKKTETLMMIYEDGRLEYGTYATIQPNSAPSGTSDAKLCQCKIFNHISAEYPAQPNVRVTGVYFHKILNDINKSSHEVYLRPYEKGLQFISVDMAKNPMMRKFIGEIDTLSSPLFYAPTYDNVTYNMIPGGREHGIVHYDHLTNNYSDIVPLILTSKLTDDTGLIKNYFHPDRDVPILFTGPISSMERATWKTFIGNKPDDKVFSPSGY